MLLSSHVQIAGRYRLEDRITVGGFGEVWRATDTVLASQAPASRRWR